MKRENGLMAAITEPENLRRAFWRAQRAKWPRDDVRAFRDTLQRRLGLLREELLAEAYVFGPYRAFKIYEPKERMISVAPFADRVVHHAVMRVCEPNFERYAIHDTYACRIAKGAQRAVSRAQVFTRRFEWFLKLDIARYFDSIHHETLLALLSRRFKDRALLRLFGRLLDSHSASPGRGLPIGNLTSQHFANYYLGRLDHWLKEDMGVQGYVRYMDDFVLWHDSREALKRLRRRLALFLEEELRLTLKQSMLLNRTALGFPFLGYKVWPHRIGLSRASARRFRARSFTYHGYLRNGIWTQPEAARRMEALIAFTRFADAAGFRGRVMAELAAADACHDNG